MLWRHSRRNRRESTGGTGIPVYLITQVTASEPQRLRPYLARIVPRIECYDGEVLDVVRAAEILEGSWPEGAFRPDGRGWKLGLAELGQGCRCDWADAMDRLRRPAAARSSGEAGELCRDRAAASLQSSPRGERPVIVSTLGREDEQRWRRP
jgi:hypothetical protein